MIYVLVNFIFGFLIGFMISRVMHRKKNFGKLRITQDTDGTYCFLVLKQHPDELKDGDLIFLLVEKGTHK